MGFRVVVIKSRSKLEFRLNSLVVRYGTDEKKVFINEINTLIVQNTAVSLTAALLNELMKNGVKVIFCDEKYNPSSELLPYYGCYNTSKRYKNQIAWTTETKALVWKKIIKKKIISQAELLVERGFYEQATMLYGYAEEIEPNDMTNREGHAAKVYFNCILGEGRSRREDSFLNGCLNYGYAVILSAVNREIVADGYLTQMGIWHDNEYNDFNLGCDLMEPLRTFVDRAAVNIETGDNNFKTKMADTLNLKVKINDKNTTLDLAIRTYVRSVIAALNDGEVSKIVFPQYVTTDDEL